MRACLAFAAVGLFAVLAGCSQSTSGGPGVTRPPSEEPLMGQAKGTFSLDVPSISLHQGGTETVSVQIERGVNFSEEVSLRIEPMPAGVTMTPAVPVITKDVNEVEFTVAAAPDAALGEFVVHVIGHPATGADAKAETKISINTYVPDAAATAVEKAQQKWDEYAAEMQTQLDEFNKKYAELKDRAAAAQGDIKQELERKRDQAKVKLDEASAKLEELKTASADRWEKVKEGVSAALEDLKTIFQ